MREKPGKTGQSGKISFSGMASAKRSGDTGAFPEKQSDCTASPALPMTVAF
jgi:hypothetical protein